MTSSKRHRSHAKKNPSPSDGASSTTLVTMPNTAASQQTREPSLQLERIGDYLRHTREQRGDDLQQIADYLCIRRSFLEAIEASRYDQFPADAYVIGFLRSYAQLLGLNGKEAIDRYRTEMAGQRKKPALSMPTPVTEGRTPSGLIMVIAALAALLIYASWYGLSTSDRAIVSVPPTLPSATDTLNSPSDVTPVPASPVLVLPPVTPEVNSTPVVPVVQPPHLVIRATQASWILISDSKGKTLYDHVLKTGEVYKVPDAEGLTLSTGNASGIVLALDGLDLPILARKPSTSLRHIPLNAERLKAMPPLPAE